MIQTSHALKQFFSSFGIPAYLSDNIPDNVQMPYITYDLIEPAPFVKGLLNASVWYRSTSTEEVSAKVDQIGQAIGNGRTLTTESGSVTLFKEHGGAFAQIRNDPNRETKRAFLSMIILADTN